MFFIDSHCHFSFSRFSKLSTNLPNDFKDKYSVDAIIKRAEEAHVKYMLAIGTELSDKSELQSIVDKYENVFRTVGIHPLEAKKHHQLYSREEISQIIEEECQQNKTVGIGEIGLDYHYEKESETQQNEIFNLQLELAHKCDLPVSIHSREAQEDTISILKNHASVGGVFHCFSGEKYFLKNALDLGFYISISGVITYKNATELQDSLRYIPLDRLLIETDCPFLAPVPVRGKLNEPTFVIYVAEKIAELLHVSVEKIADVSSQNFFNLFKKCVSAHK
ncbi:MAG: TatD family hydrolase [Holosporaceae bacterium]|nr:TatD family hydrolase [Holosporaceae bacterium]